MNNNTGPTTQSENRCRIKLPMRFMLFSLAMLLFANPVFSDDTLKPLYRRHLVSGKTSVVIFPPAERDPRVVVSTSSGFAYGVIHELTSSSAEYSGTMRLLAQYVREDEGWRAITSREGNLRTSEYLVRISLDNGKPTPGSLLMYLESQDRYGVTIEDGQQLDLKTSGQTLAAAVVAKHRTPPPHYKGVFGKSSKIKSIGYLRNIDVRFGNEDTHLSLQGSSGWLVSESSAAKVKATFSLDFTGGQFVKLQVIEMFDKSGSTWQRFSGSREKYNNQVLEFSVECTEDVLPPRAVIERMYFCDTNGKQRTIREINRLRDIATGGDERRVGSICGLERGAVYRLSHEQCNPNPRLPLFRTRPRIREVEVARLYGPSRPKRIEEPSNRDAKSRPSVARRRSESESSNTQSPSLLKPLTSLLGNMGKDESLNQVAWGIVRELEAGEIKRGIKRDGSLLIYNRDNDHLLTIKIWSSELWVRRKDKLNRLPRLDSTTQRFVFERLRNLPKDFRYRWVKAGDLVYKLEDHGRQIGRLENGKYWHLVNGEWKVRSLPAKWLLEITANPK